MINISYDRTFKSLSIRLLTAIFFRSEIKRLTNNLNLFREIVRLAQDQYQLNKGDKFLEAFLLLSNKLLIDTVACKIIWERGLYGSAHALVTVIIRTLRMTGALYLDQSLITEYLDEEKTSDLNKAFRIKFSETGLQKRLDERFGKTERGEYANLEKSLHGSSVGAKVFYARIRHNPDGTKGGDIIFDAFIEQEKAEGAINILCGAVLDMCGIFIEKYESQEFAAAKLKRYYELVNTEAQEVKKWDSRATKLEFRAKLRSRHPSHTNPSSTVSLSAPS